MRKIELTKRYFVFIISVLLQGIAIGAVARANLGNTPISSANFVLSLYTPLSLGTLTFIFNVIIIALQFFLWPKGQRRAQLRPLLLQIPTSLVFAAAIDLGMGLLNLFLPPALSYPAALTLLIGGVVLLAFSISLQVRANAAMISGEATVKIISMRFKKEFGFVKMGFDLTLVTLAIILSLIFTNFSSIDGVREGTVIGALCTGPLVRLMMPHLKFLEDFFTSDAKAPACADTAETASFKPVITIAREYGCGGRLVGRKIAEDLGIDFYDTQLIELVSKESGFSPEFVKENDQAMDSSLLFEMIMQDYYSPPEQSLSSQDALYVACSRVVRRLAHEKPCVIVGRGADAILKDNPHCFNVYLYAPTEKKLAFCQEHYGEDRETALKQMQSNDKRRAEHYQHYTGKSLSDPKNYQLCIDVSLLGIERTARLIESLVKTELKAA